MAKYTVQEIRELMELGFTKEEIIKMASGNKTTGGTKKTQGTEAKAPEKKAEAKPQKTRKEAIHDWAVKKYGEEGIKKFAEEKKSEREKQQIAYQLAKDSFTEKVEYKVFMTKYHEILKSL